ncbi:uncharacterized protein FIBRA_02837 [Fibroporia radiculosa]|uniref:Fungal-type protein kinase domain-containing protein n=1 Tax=Fibroporia radiculosa TaxID=599839 RepID=J4GN54_9APHY|nr:uncharacterized protein FIBRA_02837 [Fibroporia radiculosa]CCM00795.1 predicted protein [Fibroporia radiculosa]
MVHSRLSTTTYGWPIKYARSLNELVRAILGGVIGHRSAYRRGVLHRDASTGNILIRSDADGTDGYGVLIDFDNAIMFEMHQPLLNDPPSGTRPFMSAEILGNEYYFGEGIDEQPEVGVVASTNDNDNNTDNEDEDENHCGGHGYDQDKDKDEGENEDEDKDDWEDENHSDDESDVDDEDDKKLEAVHGPPHSVIHDLEGFFWVLLWVCISRSGPAIRRRQLNNPDPSSKFHREWSGLFEGDNVVYKKQRVMMLPRTSFVTWLTPLLPDYHKPLTHLLADLRDILQEAYREHRYDDVENLYTAFITTLEHYKADPAKVSDKVRSKWIQAQRAEDRRRRQDVGKWEASPVADRSATASSRRDRRRVSEPESPTPKRRKKPSGSGPRQG